MKRLVESFILISLVAVGTLAQSKTSVTSVENSKTTSPTVEIESQVDSPLRLFASTNLVSGDWVEIDITVENVSNKAIRAYATRNWVYPDERGRSCNLLSLTKPEIVLQPTQSQYTRASRSHAKSSKKSIRLSVDFVEFTDNSTWGIDSCECAQKLAGARAGSLILAERLQRILEKSGPAAVLKRLDAEVMKISPPSHQPSVWRYAFETALWNVAHRIRQAVGQGGLSVLGAELKRPYDASRYEIEVIKPKTP